MGEFADILYGCSLGFAAKRATHVLRTVKNEAVTMAGKRKVNFQGQEVWAEEIEFEAEKEGWNEYILHDGTRLKMKAVVSDVVRLDLYQADGNPIYIANATNVVSAIVPDSLKKKD